MAAYYRDHHRLGSLPIIEPSGYPRGYGTGRVPGIRKSTKFEDEYRTSTTSSAFLRDSSLIQPRPPSPQQTRRAVFELQDQVKSVKNELRKKDELIQQLVSVDGTPKSILRTDVQYVPTGSTYYAERHHIDATCSGENAALQVRVDKLQTQVRELETELESKRIKIKEVQSLLGSSQENEVKLSNMVRSLQERLGDVENTAGTFETVQNRSEITISSLQRELRESQEKILELESRLRKQLDMREEVENQRHHYERNYGDLFAKLSNILQLDDYAGVQPSVESVVIKITDIVQENAMLKGKILSLQEAMHGNELESKASRETIMRLVSEFGREQKISTRYTSEVEALRRDRDVAVAARSDMEREIGLLRQRLDANERALHATRDELQLKEDRFSHLDKEIRSTHLNVRTAETQFHLFREQLASLLSDLDMNCSPNEDSIKERIRIVCRDAKERTAQVDALEARARALEEQLQNQLDLHRAAEERARKFEEQFAEMEHRVRSAEGELAAGDVLRDGFRSDKESYMRGLQRLGEIMKMDRITLDLGFDLTIDALISRAEQLMRLELDTISDKSTHIYSLQRKLKSLKDQLQSKDLHIDLMRKKMTDMEERLLGKTSIERERDDESIRVRKAEKLAAKYKIQLQDIRQELTNVKAQLLGSGELKLRTIEQRKEMEDLVRQVEELEEIRKKQARKIGSLKEEVQFHDQSSQEKRVVSDNAVHALSSELRTTKNSLDAIKCREKQLLDFRIVVSRMLGLDINTLAVPDYEIISRLEKLIQAHHNHTFTSMSMAEALADVEDGFLSGYEDWKQQFSDTEPVVQRARDRARRKAQRARARSMSPVRRRDPRIY